MATNILRSEDMMWKFAQSPDSCLVGKYSVKGYWWD